MTDNERIAMLTTGALKTTMESAVKAMVAAVEAAEEKTRELREATEQFIADFEQVTSNLTDNVNAHVMACQSAIDTFQAHHLKILNVEQSEEKPKPVQQIENGVDRLRIEAALKN
jgi:Na+/phosphate symporter